MKTFLQLTIVALISGTLFMNCASESPKDYPIRPLSLTEIRTKDDFWASRIETSHRVTIPYAFRKSEESGRIDNFAIAAGLKNGQHRGVYPFDDSDVFKIIEGASYDLVLFPDPRMDAYLDSLIAIIGAAQEEDGYLYTARRNKPEWLARRSGETRWSNLAWSHELYNFGHLYEAAAAHFQFTGKRTLLDIALKNADLVAKTFGPNGIQSPPGHQEIEIGLTKLYRVTGEKKYLRLAQFFLDQRGYSHDGRELWGEYAQDHLPVLEQTEAVGHAVRAPYMYSAMLDVAALGGDNRYAEASKRLWENVVNKKLYITGGLGSVGIGERFAGNYDLPNKSAYQETCASIANVMWNQRLFLLTSEAKYIDVLERTLYNALLSGVSMQGDLFFYPNVLASRGYHERFPWFDCVCCITNISRFIPSLPTYVYALQDGTLYVNLFVASEADIPLGTNSVRIVQKTRYPWEGEVKIWVSPQRPDSFEVRIRIPGWAQNQAVPGDLYRFQKLHEKTAKMTINGEPVSFEIEKGYARLQRFWKGRDVIELTLPMPVRCVVANENVIEDAGKIALQRGPLVYCLEAPDHRDGRVLNVTISDDAELKTEFREDLLNGIVIISGKANSVRLAADGKRLLTEPQKFTAIPYYAWAHRGMGEMTVWIANDESYAEPLNRPSIAVVSRVNTSGGTGLTALNDGKEPASSGDISAGGFTWTRTDTMWVEYDFQQTEDVSEAQVYWFIDPENRILPPVSWRILAHINGKWEQVYTPYKSWGIEVDTFNKVIFETIRTDALRLEAQPRPGFSSGILEWRVN